MSRPCENCGSDFRECIHCDFYNGKFIEIPDNASNRDVTKSIFPEWFVDMIEVVILEYKESTDWWNAPYKENDYESINN